MIVSHVIDIGKIFIVEVRVLPPEPIIFNQWLTKTLTECINNNTALKRTQRHIGPGGSTQQVHHKHMGDKNGRNKQITSQTHEQW